MSTTTTPALLTVSAAAQRLGTGRHYVYNRIEDGRLPVIQLGTEKRPKYRIAAEDLEAFIAAQTSGAGAAR